MGLFKKKPKEPSEIDRLKSQIAAMAARLEESDAAKTRLGSQIQGLATRLEATPAPTPPPPPPPPPRPTVDLAEFSAVRSKLERVVERLDAAQASEPEPPKPGVEPEAFESVSRQVSTIAERIEHVDAVQTQVQSIVERIDQLDARITSISHELANQITELSGDIETQGGESEAVAMVEQLRDAQVRLANEQARYQIAFRQDLAHLADFLKQH